MSSLPRWAAGSGTTISDKACDRLQHGQPRVVFKQGTCVFLFAVAFLGSFLAGFTLSNNFVRQSVPLGNVSPHRSAHSVYAPLANFTTLSCGSTPDEARRNACAFDLLSFSWLPRQCYDRELTAEFLNHSDWHWYKQMQLSTMDPAPEPIEKSLVAEGATGDLFVTGSYHIVHCMYMWRKLHRGMEVEAQGLATGSSGAWIDSYTRDLAHTDHCSHYVLNFENKIHATEQTSVRRDVDVAAAEIESDLDTIKVRIRTKYPDCFV